MTGIRRLRAKPLRAHVWPRDPDGQYVEQSWCSARLFEEEWFGPPGSRVFDPACGWGRILKSAAAAGYTVLGADIVDRLDRKAVGRIPFATGGFLEWPPIPAVHSIVCNPPFDHVQAFCERALQIATFKVAMIMPLCRLPAARWLESLPLETVWLLTPRPSMPPGSYIAAGKKPGGGKDDFCWLVFRKDLFAWTPRLRWLHRDVEATTTNSDSADGDLRGGKDRTSCTRPALHHGRMKGSSSHVGQD
jgi:hypothetical protein